MDGSGADYRHVHLGWTESEKGYSTSVLFRVTFSGVPTCGVLRWALRRRRRQPVSTEARRDATMTGCGLSASWAATGFETEAVVAPTRKRCSRPPHYVLCGWVDQDLAFDLPGDQAIQFCSEVVERQGMLGQLDADNPFREDLERCG